MKKIFLLLSLCGIWSTAQSQKLDCRNIEDRYNSTEKYRNKSLTEDNVKKCLLAQQKIVQIEVINKGSISDVRERINLLFSKVNDGNFPDALQDYKSLGLVAKTGRPEANNWRGGSGGLMSDSGFTISKFLKVNQQYYTYKKEGDYNDYHTKVLPKEVFESSIPILNFELEMVTLFSKSEGNDDISKDINIFYGKELLKTFHFDSKTIRQKITINNLQGDLKLFLDDQEQN